jgi:hypothetical protein
VSLFLQGISSQLESNLKSPANAIIGPTLSVFGNALVKVIKKTRVIHFEISANDPEKKVAFYQNVFGWKITKWEGPQEYWLVETSPSEEPGINGGIFQPNEVFTGIVNEVDIPGLIPTPKE